MTRISDRITKLEASRPPNWVAPVRVVVWPGEALEEVIAREHPERPDIVKALDGRGPLTLIARCIVAPRPGESA